MCHSFNYRIKDLFFLQPCSLERVALLRVITVLIALLMLAFGPYDSMYHIDAVNIMFRAKFPFLPPLGEGFIILKAITIVLGILSLFGIYTRYALALFTIGYCYLNFLIHSYQNHYCMNQAHLNFILMALVFARTDYIFAVKKPHFGTPLKSEMMYASWVLTFAGTFIVLLLFQTGLSKLIYGGLGWFFSGDTLYVETIIDGTWLGRKLTAVGVFFPIAGISVAFFELGMPWLFFWKKYHVLLGATLLIFHLGTFLFMGISFWFLWPLYIPILLMADKVPSFMVKKWLNNAN